jgi:vacuolar protein sorting-associated protein 13D
MRFVVDQVTMGQVLLCILSLLSQSFCHCSIFIFCSCKMNVLNGLLNNKSMYCLQVAVSQFAALKHQFVLSPVNAQAHVKRNRSEKPLRSRTQPRIICDLHLEEVPLSLTDVSYKYVLLKVDYFILNQIAHFILLCLILW